MCDDPSSVVWVPNKRAYEVCVRVDTEEENCVCSGTYTIDGSASDIEHVDVYNSTLCIQAEGDISQIDFEVYVRFVKAGGTAQIMAALECDGEDPLVYCHEVAAAEGGQELKAEIGVISP